MEYINFRIGNTYHDIELDGDYGPIHVGTGKVVGIVFEVKTFKRGTYNSTQLVKLGDFNSCNITDPDVIGLKTILGAKYKTRRVTR
jgi:hypothetical protein